MDGGAWRGFADEQADEEAIDAGAASPAIEIGCVSEVGSGAARARLDGAAIARLHDAGDDRVSEARAGEVGSLVKLRAGAQLLVATIRALTLEQDGAIGAELDFLGEGTETGDGRLRGFRRGVTRYPLPGAPIHAATDADMRQIFAADDRAHIEIGTVHPTATVRGALYIDALLGRHFALVGSTGTGKSTSLALILHRICEAAPEGHIVMIDPHGEYPAAFEGYGELFDVENLALPYWLMNFEEHAEVV